MFRSFGLTASSRTPLDIVVGLIIPFVAISLAFLAEWALGAITVTGGADDWSGFGGQLGTTVFGVVVEELIFRVLIVTLVFVYLKLIWRDGSIARLEFAPEPTRRA
ncbi:hypothetical protein [Microbacterium sp. C7(2022)]|uniref:hypothetical protein n=1 Tax=Microbacterium sp. C7(2022) TaxID=2992759 RepID=UPI00237A9548|nr:hypothetical protein [Microbacterium sp. C7(2022)]MDE0547621.1 hypothetical protein [Microbacterium sp. C7(2022)]